MRAAKSSPILESNPDIADISGHPIVDSLDLETRIGGITDNVGRKVR
jgi:hypothetical protein